MKIKLPIYWDFKSQEESEVIVNVPNAAAKKVLMAFLMRKDYDERREWLIKNVPEINLNIPKELLWKRDGKELLLVYAYRFLLSYGMWL